MNITTTNRFFCLTLLLLTGRFADAAEDHYADSIKTYLRENFAHTNLGMVIGIVDERGSRIFSAGKLDNGTGGYSAFVGFDKRQHRGVVALCNQPGWSTIAWAILQRMPLTQESKTQFIREIVGFGIAFDLDQQTRRFRITKVFPKSPASQAGLSAGLVIERIGNVPTTGKSVAECLSFYEKAFGLTRRFFNDDNGKAYGELETGAARLAFASLELVKAHLKQEIVVASPDKAPLGFEVALVTQDVPALYARAVKAGATSVSEPATKPWGQTVAYLRDSDGHFIEVGTHLP